MALEWSLRLAFLPKRNENTAKRFAKKEIVFSRVVSGFNQQDYV